MIGYTCKYTPIELLCGFGEECVLLNSEVESFDGSQNAMHANFCSHAKAVYEEIHQKKIKSVVLVNCCDSIRRLYDALRHEGMEFVFLMDLPHCGSVCAREKLIEELKRLIDEYSAYSGKSFDVNKFFASFKMSPSVPTGRYVGVAGARAGDNFLDIARRALPLEVVDITCSGNRTVTVPDSNADYLASYAARLLEQTPCMRMGDVSARRDLYAVGDCAGIIYHTVKFCDYYDFEFSSLKKSTDIPLLKIETDFTYQADGQLSTRFEGFAESLGIKKEKREDSAVARTGKLFVGIDSGSTTTNLVALNESGEVVAKSIVRTGANASAGAAKAMEEAGINEKDAACIVATGYGRKNLNYADVNITEISCHAKGAHRLCPGADTVIDIGGQDCKVITLDPDGSVRGFNMNDKCAAGTGRFIENMAKVLELDMDGIAQAGLKYGEDITISSMCTVFAESEVVSLVAGNTPVCDIVHGLNKSVAAKIKTLLGRSREPKEIIMTGGGARNLGVVRELEKLTGKSIFVPENPDLCGALGAALTASEMNVESTSEDNSEKTVELIAH